MLSNAAHLALIEVSVAYLRKLLKVQDLDGYLEENPDCRREIVEEKMKESDQYFKFLFSSLDIDLERDAKKMPRDQLLTKLLAVRTQIDVILEDQEKNRKARDKLKNLTS